VYKEAAVAVTKIPSHNPGKHQKSQGHWILMRRFAALFSGVLAASAGSNANAGDLPEDSAEALIHTYNGGGVTATGPALLVRKKLVDKVSVSASYYLDSVSNASIDVVTTASPYREKRNEIGFGAEYNYRDAQISYSTSSSREADYIANRVGLDISQETFGGMTTVSLGFTRGADEISKHNAPEFHERAAHWQYRLGLTQILTQRWIMSANMEALADDGFLGSPYRIARVFGAAVPERTPRTRSARALKFRVIGDLGKRDALHIGYRYYWDNWDIKAHTVEFGYSRHIGEKWLADTSLRHYKQDSALFYSDNASSETLYISRNRQLSTFNSTGLGGKLAYNLDKISGKYEVKLNAALEFTRFKFSDFTDIRTGKPYSYNATIFQMYVSSNF
jgi:hypothetical protein